MQGLLFGEDLFCWPLAISHWPLVFFDKFCGNQWHSLPLGNNQHLSTPAIKNKVAQLRKLSNPILVKVIYKNYLLLILGSRLSLILLAVVVDSALNLLGRSLNKALLLFDNLADA